MDHIRIREPLIDNRSIPSLFACLTVQCTILKHSAGARRSFLQHRTQLCLLSLAEIKASWPCAGWMYEVFQNLVEHSSTQSVESLLANPGALTGDEIPVLDVVVNKSHSPSQVKDFSTEQNVTFVPESSTLRSLEEDYQFTASSATNDSGYEDGMDPFEFLDSLDWTLQSSDLAGEDVHF